MTILIIGGAGFIGSHLCNYFITKHKVICLDNLLTGNKKNIKHLLHNINFTFIQHDIINPFDISADYILNFACPASPIHYQSDPIYTTKINTIGILNILECAKKYNSLILQASTSEIYGQALIHPQNEQYWGNVNSIGIRSCYDEGKRLAESLYFDYYRQYNLNIKIIRIFNTYGPNMMINDGRVISNFIIQALNNQDITIYGKGNQTRSFCYISDLVNGINLMLNKNNFIGPVNLGNPQEITILELAKLIIKLTNSKSQIKFLSLPEDDPIKRCPDITLAKQQLNWYPLINLENGLISTINYFKNLLGK